MLERDGQSYGQMLRGPQPQTRQPDPFGGNGVFVNGRWLPKDHPDAIQYLAQQGDGGPVDIGMWSPPPVNGGPAQGSGGVGGGAAQGFSPQPVGRSLPNRGSYIPGTDWNGNPLPGSTPYVNPKDTGSPTQGIPPNQQFPTGGIKPSRGDGGAVDIGMWSPPPANGGPAQGSGQSQSGQVIGMPPQPTRQPPVVDVPQPVDQPVYSRYNPNEPPSSQNAPDPSYAGTGGQRNWVEQGLSSAFGNAPQGAPQPVDQPSVPVALGNPFGDPILVVDPGQPPPTRQPPVVDVPIWADPNNRIGPPAAQNDRNPLLDEPIPQPPIQSAPPPSVTPPISQPELQPLQPLQPYAGPRFNEEPGLDGRGFGQRRQMPQFPPPPPPPQPLGPLPTSNESDPFRGDGVLVNGGWLPKGHPEALRQAQAQVMPPQPLQEMSGRIGGMYGGSGPSGRPMPGDFGETDLAGNPMPGAPQAPTRALQASQPQKPFSQPFQADTGLWSTNGGGQPMGDSQPQMTGGWGGSTWPQQGGGLMRGWGRPSQSQRAAPQRSYGQMLRGPQQAPMGGGWGGQNRQTQPPAGGMMGAQQPAAAPMSGQSRQPAMPQSGGQTYGSMMAPRRRW